MGSLDTPRRGRPPKARLEGGTAVIDAPIVSVPVGDNGAALARIVAYFKAAYPDAWEELRLCPLQHGLDDMANRLRG
jgi:hypothetical protein